MRNTRASFWLIGLVSLALTGSLACQRDEPVDRAPYTPPDTQAVPEEARTDWGITTSVQARFFTDDAVRGRQIDVTTNDGVVTLRGTVDNEAARQQAVRIASNVEGVARVDDQLQVATATTGTEPAEEPGPRDRPTDRTDAAARDRTADRVNAGWITTKIQAQYFMNPQISPWNIDVSTTSDGVVTLRGEVDSAEDRQEAVRLARATEGVVRVEDHLRLRHDAAAATAPGEERDREETRQPDIWLTAKIQSKYFLDEDVKGRNINVDTQDGVVTLRGSVATDAEKRQAVALARNTDGVRDVRDELTIAPVAEPVPGLPAETRTDRPGGAMERLGDGWITTKIQSQYFMDDEVKGTRVNVSTRDGVVTLKGQVESDAARQKAETIAAGTEGVKKVENQLTVGTQQPR